MISNKNQLHMLASDDTDECKITDIYSRPDKPLVGTKVSVFVKVAFYDDRPAGKNIIVNWTLNDRDAYFYGKKPGEPYTSKTDVNGHAVANFYCDDPLTVTITASVGDASDQTKSLAVVVLSDTTVPLDLNPLEEGAPPNGQVANKIEAVTDDKRAYQIEFTLDTELMVAYFKDDDGSTSQRYRTTTDDRGSAIASFYANSLCEGQLTAKIYSDDTYTTVLNSKEQPFVFTVLQLNFPVDRQLTPADGTSTQRTYAYIEDEAPLDICVTFNLSGSSSAKFVEADNVAILPGGQSATAIIIKGTTRTPQIAFVDDNLFAETVTIQASSAGVCEPTTGLFPFSMGWQAKLPSTIYYVSPFGDHGQGCADLSKNGTYQDNDTIGGFFPGKNQYKIIRYMGNDYIFECVNNKLIILYKILDQKAIRLSQYEVEYYVSYYDVIVNIKTKSVIILTLSYENILNILKYIVYDESAMNGINNQKVYQVCFTENYLKWDGINTISGVCTADGSMSLCWSGYSFEADNNCVAVGYIAAESIILGGDMDITKAILTEIPTAGYISSTVTNEGCIVFNIDNYAKGIQGQIFVQSNILLRLNEPEELNSISYHTFDNILSPYYVVSGSISSSYDKIYRYITDNLILGIEEMNLNDNTTNVLISVNCATNRGLPVFGFTS